MSFLLFDLEGQTLTAEEKSLIQHPGTAGIVLFSRNFENYEQLSNLIIEVRQHSADKPFLISVDQEGGRVQRLTKPFTTLPALGDVTKLNIDHHAKLALIEDLGWLMASEVRSAGIDLSFAPVLDVDIGISTVIGSRSLGSEPEWVAEAGIRYIKGMHSAGMKATVKHYPGHGGVIADSHLTSPVDTRSKDQIFSSDLYVFKEAISECADAVMPAHVVFQDIHSEPASFSSYWLNKVLRKQLGFTGVVFSDDLTMKAAQALGNPTNRAIKALTAGCDILLCCNDREAVNEMLDNVDYRPYARESTRSIYANSVELPSKDKMANIHNSSRYQRILQQLTEN